MRRAAVGLGQLALPFVVVALCWQAFAVYGPFPPRLFPQIDTIVSAFVRLIVTGVKAVKQIWIRAAEAMGASEQQMFRNVVLPGALPYVLNGLRLGLARAWRVLIAVEMLTSVSIGLGWLIFGAREFMNTDVMLAGIAVIGLVGLGLEKLVFERVEKFTVVRWGMLER